MKFRFLLFISFFLVLTGCSATYNLEIKNKDFIENVSITDDNSLDYFRITVDCRTNSYLENYNAYLKYKLDKFRIFNWVNFMHFIKKKFRV